jgi:DNA polymerase-4
MFVSVRAILHIDMDAFFASVEQTRQPELRGRPVVVGGEHGGRGVVSTASYEARAFGVRTAMPVAHAERLCPHAVFLPVDMAAYTAVAGRVIEICRRFTDLVEVASIDEAFLDVTGSRRLFGPPATIAGRIQELVYDECGLTCSIGIAENKLLAKLASNLKKPCGISALSGADVHGRLRDLPVRDLWGIGPVTEQRLAALGLTTIGMLQDVPFSLLAAAFGKGAYGLRQIAFGRSLSPLHTARPLPKSIGRETTFAEDSNDREFLTATLLALVDQVMTSMRKKGLAARTVTVKVRYSTFHTVSRRATLPRATSSTRQICRTVAGLLSAIDLQARWVRLVGVSVGDLTHNAFQLTFDEHWRDIALGDAVDRIRAKYGRRAVALAVAALADPRRVKAQTMC